MENYFLSLKVLGSGIGPVTTFKEALVIVET